MPSTLATGEFMLVEINTSPQPENIHVEAGDAATGGAFCVECLGAVVPDGVADKDGATLCRACAESFYVACASCGGLVARDEALAKQAADAAGQLAGASDDDGSLVCAACFAGGLPETIDAEEMETLVRQFVELHAEKKSLETRLDELKERLKVAAQGRQRIEGAVVMRAGEAGVRISYTLKTTADAARVAALTSLLDAEEFSSLFKTAYSPVKERVEEFLSGTDEAHAPAREALRDCIQHTEVPTLTVVAQKKPRPSRGKKDS